MKSLYFCILFLTVIAIPAVSQRWNFSAGLNYGTYSMKDLNQWQKYMTVENVPLTITETFPNTTGLEFSFLRSFRKNSVGAFITSASTGGRSSYADYSGSITRDIICKNMVIGVEYQPTIKKRESWEIYFGLRNGFSFNTVNLTSRLRLGNENQDFDQELKSINIMGSVGLGARIFYRRFFLQPEVRAEVHFVKGELFLHGEEEPAQLNGESAKVGWDGARFSLTLGYSI